MFETKLYLEEKTILYKLLFVKSFQNLLVQCLLDNSLLSCLSEQCYVRLRPPDDC